MKKHLATVLQVVGTTIITMSVAFLSIPVALFFAGIAMVAFGIAVERN
jgi:uncharacterized membrane protein